MAATSSDWENFASQLARKTGRGRQVKHGPVDIARLWMIHNGAGEGM